MAVIAVLGLGCAACWICTSTPVQEKMYNESRPAPGHLTVDVNIGTLDGGDVTILRSDTGDVQVNVSTYYGTPDSRITFSGDSERLRLSVVTYAVSDEMFSLQRSRTNVTIHVPEGTRCDATIKTSNGNVRIAPLEGGSLVIIDPIRGPTKQIRIEGGNYTSLYVSTSGERTRNAETFARFNSSNAVFDLCGGQTIIETGQTSGRLRATTGGKISVTLPPEAGFYLDAATDKGSVMCSFPMDSARDATGILKGPAGTSLHDGFNVTLRSTGGDISVEN